VGFLTIDHRGTLNPDGTKGTLKQVDTVACKHCGAVVAKILGAVEDYEPKRRCTRCHGAICAYCASLVVFNPIAARIEHAIKVGYWDESYQYEYKIAPN
jgi:hypothetical protein